jgi:phosphate transport system substrate-binding protein
MIIIWQDIIQQSYITLYIDKNQKRNMMKKVNSRLILLAFIALAGTVLMSCQSKSGSKTDGKLTGSLTIDGSSTVYPITEAVAEEFQKVNPKVKVTVGESGTGGGFKKFSRAESDINDASRSIKQEEIDACKANGVNYIELEIAYDGLAVMVNPKNTWVDHLTVAELKKIWEPEAQGKLMRWNQIRPEWPNKEIHLFGPGTASGTFDYFTEAVVGKAKSSRGDYTASEDDNVLVQGISNDELALGYFGLAYFENNQDKLKLVGIDDQKDENGKGPILPNQQTVMDKSYSPLSRPLFIYPNSKSLERPEVKAFVDFYLENGGALAKEVGYIPLNDTEFQTMKAKWEDFVKTHTVK